MRLKLSIAQQGIALALIPLVFESIFIAALINALQDNEREIQKQFFYRSIIEESNILQRNALDYTASAALYNLYGREDLKNSKNEKAVRLLQELSTLQNLCRGEPILEKPLNDLRQGIQELFNDLNEQKPGHTIQSPKMRAIESMAILFAHSLTTDVVDALHSCYQTVAQLDKKRSESQKQSEMRLNKIIAAGIVFNILISLALAFLFAKNIKSRLAILNNNALRMKLHQPLNEPVRGVDEIATLDKTFHEMAQELAEADAQKNELLGFMNTKLQTPLKKILQHLENTQAHPIRNVTVQKKLKPLRGNVLRLYTLIEELLAVESINSGKLILYVSNCSLKSILESATSAMQGYATSKKIQIVFDDNDIHLEADPVKIEQVIINLVSNAIKFSPPESTIEIKIRNQNENFLEVVVADHGPGIPKEKLSLLFERFGQANPALDTKIGGSGLGLNICKKIVEAHGGQIGITSEIGVGSEFWFSLPLIQLHKEGEMHA